MRTGLRSGARIAGVVLGVVGMVASLSPALAQGGGTTTRVSVASGGAQANDSSSGPVLSADGRFVAFESSADNLVPGDTNFRLDVFVHDRETLQTTRVSVSSTGAQGGESSYNPSISADGRYVAFESWADEFAPGDLAYTQDVFVHDRVTGQTVLVSAQQGAPEPVAGSTDADISADGRLVAFLSTEPNMVAGDTNGYLPDVFVRDWQAGQTELITVSSSGTQANQDSYFPRISDDGRFVAFYSYANNLVAGDTNGDADVFTHDRSNGQTRRISVASNGQQGNADSSEPSLSSNGRYVAFVSFAGNLVRGDTNQTYDVFVHDQATGRTTRVSVPSGGGQANSFSVWPSISGDGRYVAFESYASNLGPGDTNNFEDVYIHDRATRQTIRASLATDGTQPPLPSQEPDLAAVGSAVTFFSESRNLVPNDTNQAIDVFVRELQ